MAREFRTIGVVGLGTMGADMAEVFARNGLQVIAMDVDDDAIARGVAHPAEVVSRAAEGETQARAALERYADRLARGLATVVNVLDPDVIVLGGGMSNVASLYADVAARLPPYVFSDHVATPIVPPKHGDSSGVRGAAWLWPPAGR